MVYLYLTNYVNIKITGFEIHWNEYLGLLNVPSRLYSKHKWMVIRIYPVSVTYLTAKGTWIYDNVADQYSIHPEGVSFHLYDKKSPAVCRSIVEFIGAPHVILKYKVYPYTIIVYSIWVDLIYFWNYMGSAYGWIV